MTDPDEHAGDDDGDDRQQYLAGFLSNMPGLVVLAWTPAVLLVVGAVAIYFTEDSSVFRFVVTVASGVAMSLVLHGMLAIAGGSARREVSGAGQSKLQIRIAWTVLIAAGLALVAWGSIMVVDELDYASRAEHVIAEVLSMERSGSSSDSGTRGTVRFTTPDGQTITADLDPLPTADLDGRAIEVRYDAANANDVRSAHELSTWGLPLLLLGAGLLLAGYSIGKAIRTRAFSRS